MMNRQKHVSHLAAILALVGASALWGASFASVKICGNVLNEATPADVTPAFGPVLFTACRFTLAFILVWLFWGSARRWRPRRAEMVPLLQVALPMAAGFILQASGLAFTTATISGFITGLCVCLTPFAEWRLLGRPPTRRLAAAVALAMAGVALMTRTDSQGFSIRAGEILTLLCVLAFTIQIVYTGQSSERLGAGPLTAGSFAVIALAAWMVVGVMAPSAAAEALWRAAHDIRFWEYFLLTLLLATIGAQILMNAFQRFIRPSEAAVVYTSEPVFAAVFAVMLIGWSEFPGWLGTVGAALMIAANLLVAVKPPAPSRDASANTPP